jgi:hypothetical protein
MLARRTPLAAMSAKKRAKLDAAGTQPFSTLSPAASQKPVMRAAAPIKRRRYTPAVPKETRDALITRSGGWCEIGRPGCLGQGTDPSHRITVKAGGRHGDAKALHNRLSNILWACRACHDWIGRHPAAAKTPRVGWALEEWQAPAACPALYRGRLVLLDDDGAILPCPPHYFCPDELHGADGGPCPTCGDVLCPPSDVPPPPLPTPPWETDGQPLVLDLAGVSTPPNPTA